MRKTINIALTTVTRVLALSTLLLGLSACSNDMGDLEQWIVDIKAKKGGRIEPLPIIPPYKPYEYPAHVARSPFIAPTEANEVRGDEPKGPDLDRAQEYLEEFPLDALRMVGTIRPGNATLALVQDADGLLHRVTAGNYIGQNHGRIVGVDEAEVKLIEIVADGLGGWMERPAALALGN